jgi:glycosyltransferase involved in cell wall biosynthesis
MKALWVADVPWWCLSRDGRGLAAAHGTEHEWHVDHVREGPTPFRVESVAGYDLVRFGCVPLYARLARQLPKGRRYVLSVASFREAEEEIHDPGLPLDDDVLGIVVNDQRHVPLVSGLGYRVVYSAGKVAAAQWFSEPARRPHEGPLRVGWAGSESEWGPALKNVAGIQEACQKAGVRFIRQRREDDGILDADGMRQWYNSLDVYVSLNVERTCTPVPILEALRCGVPVVTSRCGEVWPLVAAVEPALVLDEPTGECLARSLTVAKTWGRRRLQQVGLRLLRATEGLTWEAGEARRVTETLAGWLKC